MNVFNHFVYCISGQTLVFADLQGSPVMINNHSGLKLFDVMTHTNTGTSGIGDFGLEGLHMCGEVCNNTMVDLEAFEIGAPSAPAPTSKGDDVDDFDDNVGQWLVQDQGEKERHTAGNGSSFQ
ncbi:hypothetical protein D9758_017392 [Tetrapyrgos nigripes]|uniref:Alpha-type protein kinase domain-containing protein n=1 Tax=Tetrapyrgos nigripes TaxID=182062 RepID=A0A8H5C5A8_9AGAR|nr:hypothetical protein D9758_017392 [Tetrapyrgos nigripes]